MALTVVVATLLIGNRNYLRAFVTKSHRLAVLDEMLQVKEFRRAPVVNNAGTELHYIRNLPRGLGIYKVDLATGKEELFFQTRALDRGGSAFRLFSWSPDDRYLLFKQPVDGGKYDDWLMLFDRKDGSIRPAPEVRGSIEQVVWMSPTAFAFLNKARTLYIAELLPGTERGGRVMELKRREGEPGLNAIARHSSTTLLLADQAGISVMDLLTRQLRPVLTLTNGSTSWLTAPNEQGEMLFSYADTAKNYRLWRLASGADGSKGPVELSNAGEQAYYGQWIQRGSGEACLAISNGVTFLRIRPKDRAGETNLFTAGSVRSLAVTPKGDKVYAVASPGAEPFAIWEYDLAQHSLRCVILGTERPFAKAAILEPIRESFKTEAGMTVYYRIIPPKDFKPGRRYPAVIGGPMDNVWKLQPQLLANLGVYYVAVSRGDLINNPKEVQRAADAMLAVHEKLLKNTNIDPGRIFLSGFSAETMVLAILVEKHPAKWRGVGLHSPIALPNLTGIGHKMPRVFISIGEEDWNLENVHSFEEQACKSLVSLEVAYCPNSPHIVTAAQAIRLAESRFAEFVLH
ncbi:MAG: hypothetical protein EB141_02105 [Verrucomicrobia bacterium]|nr:hypothetical protein [Verrucomicrobiota bacterium]NBU10418.1 hypothetical protein [Pseudomonadota bacterium]NDA65639.1 hypothetical protein [Verrucomicrobiota bacterium]NDB74438.1 hypothetical protein [Verrucomicrobiota bacterium]NDD37518.1 hypothetical protein [Verrucomicrobiota bacterium]